MARPLRIEYEGALYHVTGRGNRRERVFEDEKDWARFLALLRESLPRYQVQLHAYVLMGNHYHLLAETQRANLGRWMHWLVTSYTVYFNRRHGRVGHLFQGRYKSIVMEAEGYLLALSRYIHLNPVRGARLGRGDPADRRRRLRGWRWSSYRGYAGLAASQPMVTEGRVLDALGGAKGRQRVAYRRYVEEGLLREVENPLEASKWQAVLGSERFAQQVIDQVSDWRERRRESRALRQTRRHGPSPEAIVAEVAKAYGMTPSAVLQQRGRNQEAKGVAMALIWQLCDRSLREIGAMFGGRDYAAVAQQVRRTKGRALETNRAPRFEKLLKICQRI